MPSRSNEDGSGVGTAEEVAVRVPVKLEPGAGVANVLKKLPPLRVGLNGKEPVMSVGADVDPVKSCSPASAHWMVLNPKFTSNRPVPPAESEMKVMSALATELDPPKKKVNESVMLKKVGPELEGVGFVGKEKVMVKVPFGALTPEIVGASEA